MSARAVLTLARHGRWVVGVLGLELLGLGFLPLFGGPTYEFALVAGLLAPAHAAVAAVLAHRGTLPGPRAALGTSLGLGAAAAFVVGLVATLHGLRAGFCEAGAGYWLLLLGPSAGAFLGAVWGAVVVLALTARGRALRARWAVPLALAGPLASVGVGLFRFLSSPMVFAYDPFVGFFAGTLYDTIIDPSELEVYRLGTLCTLGAVGAGARLLRRRGGALALSLRGRRTEVAIAGGLALASMAVSARGPSLGHWHTASSIRAALGGEWQGERCEVVHARSIDRESVLRFGAECDAHVRQLEAWFGAPYPWQVTAFLFESAAQKGKLMGASGTYIAKPWRREVYLHDDGFPHPVLGHELAHVLAGQFARGPFRVAGSVGGWLPDPGLIEGTAVAASPHETDVSPAEWARAMKELGLLPPLSRLFALGFLGHNSSLAYTVSGAFVGWVHATYGPEAVRRWYGGAELVEVTGKPLGALEADFHAHLDALAVSARTLAQAKARFDRPSVFGRRCPHAVDACIERGRGSLRAGDTDAALRAFAEAQSLDPADPWHELRRADALIRAGELVEARAILAALAGPATASDLRLRAAETLADLDLATGARELALGGYEALLAKARDEDHARTLEVKRIATQDERASDPIVELLVGKAPRPADRTRALVLLGSWSAERPADGLPRYLLARQFASGEDYALALEHAEAALAALSKGAALGTPQVTPRVEAEAHRIALVAACALGDQSAVLRHASSYDRAAAPPPARKAAVRAFAERCRQAP